MTQRQIQEQAKDNVYLSQVNNEQEREAQENSAKAKVNSEKAEKALIAEMIAVYDTDINELMLFFHRGQGYEEVSEYVMEQVVFGLIEADKDLNKQDSRGNTILGMVVGNPENHELVDTLLSNDADPFMSDKMGISVFDAARGDQTVSLLLAAMKKKVGLADDVSVEDVEELKSQTDMSDKNRAIMHMTKGEAELYKHFTLEYIRRFQEYFDIREYGKDCEVRENEEDEEEGTVGGADSDADANWSSTNATTNNESTTSSNSNNRSTTTTSYATTNNDLTNNLSTISRMNRNVCNPSSNSKTRVGIPCLSNMSDDINKERFNCAMDAVIHDIIKEDSEEEDVTTPTSDLFTAGAIKEGLKDAYKNTEHPENVVVGAFWTFYIRNKKYIYFFRKEESNA